MSLRSFVVLAGVPGLLALGVACGGDDTGDGAAETPPEVPVPVAKPVEPQGMRVDMHRFGPIAKTVKPTVEALREVLPDLYGVEPAGEHAVVDSAVAHLFLGDRRIAEVLASDDGQTIRRIWSDHEHVVFPWVTRVGDRIGDHKHWDRMTCTLADPDFGDERAVCFAFEAARIAYLIQDWPGYDPESPELPGKELLAEQPITGMVWTPGGGGEE